MHVLGYVQRRLTEERRASPHPTFKHRRRVRSEGNRVNTINHVRDGVAQCATLHGSREASFNLSWQVREEADEVQFGKGVVVKRPLVYEA